MTSPCPCGSGRPERACCAPLHAGEPAPTAEALMRSRFTAFVRGEVDYLVRTHAPETREPRLREELVEACQRTRYTKLEVLDRRHGGADDTEGEVEFVAHGVYGGRTFAMRERSRFRREAGQWLYVDGKVAR